MRFIVDSMLGKLAKWLRILGWDTLYYNKLEKGGMIKIAQAENRIILTRDTKLLARRDLNKLVFIKDNNYGLQLREVLDELSLTIDSNKLLSRCLLCNKLLEKIPLEEVEGKVPEYVWQHNRKYSFCSLCKKIYWRGTHVDKALQMIEYLDSGS